jgi:hypothetical protein
MSEARSVADMLTEAVAREDLRSVTGCYGSNAVLIAPEGVYMGRDRSRSSSVGGSSRSPSSASRRGPRPRGATTPSMSGC